MKLTASPTSAPTFCPSTSPTPYPSASPTASPTRYERYVVADGLHAQKWDCYVYAVMDGTSKFKSCSKVSCIGCQTSLLRMPEGWSLVPYSRSIIFNVVVLSPSEGTWQWGTNCLLFQDGRSFQTNNGDYCGADGLLRRASAYAPRDCNAPAKRVLIRKRMPQGNCQRDSR